MSLFAKLFGRANEETRAADERLRLAEKKQRSSARATDVERTRVVNIATDVRETAARLSSRPPRPMRSPSTIDPTELEDLELEDHS